MSPTGTSRRVPLTRAGVIDRAVALADRDGLPAVTVRRIAAELDVTPMALYWHFRTKEDLLAGLADRVLDDVDAAPATGDWAADLRVVLCALLTAMRPHPQLADLVIDRLLEHPMGLALTETALLSLSAAGFDPEPASYLATHALRTAIAAVTVDHADDDCNDTRLRRTAALASLPPRQYPTLAAHAEAITHSTDGHGHGDLAIDLFIAGAQALCPHRHTCT